MFSAVHFGTCFAHRIGIAAASGGPPGVQVHHLVIMGFALVVLAMLFIFVIILVRNKPGLDHSPLPDAEVQLQGAVPEVKKMRKVRHAIFLKDTASEAEVHRRRLAIENLGRSEACRLATRLLNQEGGLPEGKIWFLAGPGPAGAAALVACRHLDALGIPSVAQQMVFTDRMCEDARRELRVLEQAGLKPIANPSPQPLRNVHLVVQAVTEKELTEGRKDNLERIQKEITRWELPLETFEEYSPYYAPPAPNPEEIIIPAPVGPVSREEVRLLDSLGIDHYGMHPATLMENAGYWAAREVWLLARQIADEKGRPEPHVVVICGRGNNGGDGFVVARHLQSWGINLQAVNEDFHVFLLAAKPRVTDDTRRNLNLLEEEGVKVQPIFDDTQWTLLDRALEKADLIVDAILGTGLLGNVRGSALEAFTRIEAAQARGAKLVALDIPSGLDCNTGEPLGAALRADLTVTFAASKLGFHTETGATYTGDLVIADIGLPRALYRKRGMLDDGGETGSEIDPAALSASTAAASDEQDEADEAGHATDGEVPQETESADATATPELDADATADTGAAGADAEDPGKGAS